MKLTDYLKKEKIKEMRFAADLDISYATLRNWISGKYSPNLHHIQKISEMTNNKVTAKDFFGDKHGE